MGNKVYGIRRPHHFADHPTVIPASFNIVPDGKSSKRTSTKHNKQYRVQFIVKSLQSSKLISVFLVTCSPRG